MRPEDQYPYGKSGHDRSVSRFDLFYYERVGERFYLRLTPLAATLVLSLTLLSIAGIIFLFLYNSGRARPMTDVNIRVSEPPAVPAPQNPIIMPAKPAPRPPRAVTPTLRATNGERGQGARPGPHPGTDIKVKPVSTPPNQ